MVLTSASLFLLLLSYPAVSGQPLQPLKGADSVGSKLLKLISENTLAIFFFHLMVLEILQNGYLGVAINGNTVNSIIGVPLITVLTLFFCLAVIVPLKRVPYLKRLIG